MKKFLKILLLFILLVFIILTTVPFIYSNRGKIFDTVFGIPEYDVVCLLGARVYPGGVLSPVLKQRSDASVMLYRAREGKKIIVSGSGKFEVNNIVRYLKECGIDDAGILKDYAGYNTHDTILHLKNAGYGRPLLVSQNFHLYRAVEMSCDEKLDSLGLAAEKVAPLNEELSLPDRLAIRITRHYTGSLLLVLYKIGLYDTLSDVSEKTQRKAGKKQ